eukprot:2265140-Rhodomonas_salina.4
MRKASAPEYRSKVPDLVFVVTCCYSAPVPEGKRLSEVSTSSMRYASTGHLIAQGYAACGTRKNDSACGAQ